MSTGSLRDRVIVRLVEDLVGPLTSDEVLADRPSQRYSTGILYPRGSRIRPEENEDGGQEYNHSCRELGFKILYLAAHVAQPDQSGDSRIKLFVGVWREKRNWLALCGCHGFLGFAFQVRA